VSFRHARHHGWKGRPPLRWILARGIHRTVVIFLVLAAGLGAAGGVGLMAARESGAGVGALVCLALGVCGVMWPLAWVATVRIAWPLRALAEAAGELKGGRLDARADLPGGPNEVGEVAGALRGMADRVAKQLVDQRALLAAVSHELRSPLGRARVLVEMSREGSAPATLHDDLQAEIDAMDGLVGDLLTAARIDFEAVAPRAMDAADLGRRALEIAREPVDKLRIEGEGSVLADPTLAARALASLVDNARRYGGALVVLRVRPREGRVRFEVDDDGPGFAPGDEVRAFEPFWRGPADGRPKPRGEGLGLALVRQIAEAQAGEAGAQNRPEGGARVWIELPRGGNEAR
jgi:two-component system OmpR family sensor kinase